MLEQRWAEGGEDLYNAERPLVGDLEAQRGRTTTRLPAGRLRQGPGRSRSRRAGRRSAPRQLRTSRCWRAGRAGHERGGARRNASTVRASVSTRRCTTRPAPGPPACSTSRVTHVQKSGATRARLRQPRTAATGGLAVDGCSSPPAARTVCQQGLEERVVSRMRSVRVASAAVMVLRLAAGAGYLLRAVAQAAVPPPLDPQAGARTSRT